MIIDARSVRAAPRQMRSDERALPGCAMPDVSNAVCGQSAFARLCAALMCAARMLHRRDVVA